MRREAALKAIEIVGIKFRKVSTVRNEMKVTLEKVPFYLLCM